jgi:magnesium-transporting ATPase (P-type)
VEIFHEYDDTVVAVGLSHLTRNEDIFANADVAVGIDILEETADGTNDKSSSLSQISKSEFEFVQSISSQSCAFRLRGASSVAYISTILEKSRASLDASVSSAMFLIFGCMTYSLYVLFSVCTPATSIPYVPTIGSALYLLFMLPSVGLSMQMTDGEANVMKRVPMKNEKTNSIGKRDSLTFITRILVKAVPPAFLPQILHMITFGELVIKFDSIYVTAHCPEAKNWVDIVRCEGMKHYVGSAKSSAGSLVLAQFILCVVLSSTAFVYRFQSLRQQLPWERNILWMISLIVAIGVLIVYIIVSTKQGTAASLPWYFYVISITSPFLCVMWVEYFKRSETKQEERSEKVRRLQFETRLGAWSPR